MPYDPNYSPISGSFITSANLVVSTSGSAPIGGFKGIYIAGSGNFTPVGDDNTTAGFFNAVAGTILWISGKYVDASGLITTHTASVVGLR